MAAAEEGLNEEGAPELAGNFRITDEELGAGGSKQKFARNIKAIKTLFTLEQEHRGATAEEQQEQSCWAVFLFGGDAYSVSAFQNYHRQA